MFKIAYVAYILFLFDSNGIDRNHSDSGSSAATLLGSLWEMQSLHTTGTTEPLSAFQHGWRNTGLDYDCSQTFFKAEKPII